MSLKDQNGIAFADGARVTLSDDYRSFTDAGDGPIQPGDVGFIAKVGQGRIKAKGPNSDKEWWYDTGALMMAKLSKYGINEGDSVVLVDNYKDIGDSDDGPLVKGGTGQCVQLGSDKFRVRAPSGKVFWYLPAAIKKTDNPFSLLQLQADMDCQLSADHDRYGDSAGGPLKVGDIGKIIKVGKTRYRVAFDGKEWWYDGGAIAKAELPNIAAAAVADAPAVQATDLPGKFETHVFLSHDWGKDANGRDNHARVGRINEGLRSRGFQTWFDAEMMHGNVVDKMASGIDNTAVVLAFITNNYISKVAGDNGPRDNCKREFEYADRRNKEMLAVVMEDGCRNPSDWRGSVGFTLSTTLYVDCANDATFEQALDDLAKNIKRSIQ